MVNRTDEIAWHYPRAELAQRYLDTLRAGLISSLVLFAPRRKGKTEFLLEDLLPAAEAAGYATVYCSMWQNRSDPLAALLLALSNAAKPKTLKAEAEFSTGSAEGQTQLQRLPEMLDTVVNGSKGKVLLAIDEVQHLAKPEFGELVAALRTTLDVRKKTVKTVFTGSSRNRLQAMFSQIKAPLFQFSQTTDFPDLDEGFVAFMMNSFTRATGRVVPLTDATAAFATLGCTPGLFHDAVERLMKAGGTDIGKVAQKVLEESRDASGYVQRLLELRPLDREVLRAILARMPLYSEETRRRLAQAVGIEGEALGTRQVQAAVERLVSEQVIFPSQRGIYEIEDEQLARWLAAAPGLIDGATPDDIEPT